MVKIRMIRAMQNLQNPKIKTREEALVKANYSLSYARSGQIEKTKTFQVLFDKAIPEKLLAKRHKQLLNKKEVKTIFNPKTNEAINVPTGEIDKEAVRSALDMAYKIKGSYAPEKHLNLNATLREALGVIEDDEKENDNETVAK